MAGQKEITIMDSVDRLLAELKAKHDQQPQSQPLSGQPSPPTSQSDLSSTAPPGSLDQLLSELQEDIKRSVRTNLSSQPSASKPQLASPKVTKTQGGEGRSLEDNALSQLKSQHKKQDRVEAFRREELRDAEYIRHQQEREKQRRLEALRVQRRAQLTEQAKEWLKWLNPKSEEGLWFEEFACNYESRLEAAIDYLEALQKVERESRKL
jgi:hypothetical protein